MNILLLIIAAVSTIATVNSPYFLSSMIYKTSTLIELWQSVLTLIIDHVIEITTGTLYNQMLW